MEKPEPLFIETENDIDEFFLCVLTEGCYQFSVFCLGTDGDAETVLAELYPMAVAHDDALIDQIVVDLRGIGHLGQEEVGVGRIDLLADRQEFEGFHHSRALFQQDLHPLIDFEWILQGFESLFLSQKIDVIGVLHLIKHRDNHL